MALRDQPYLPLYIQDIMTDEKLNECCAATHGIYIKGIMCLMHKSEHYGKILLKQKYKQNESICLNFATQIAKHLPYSLHEINEAITELIREEVLYFDGDFLCQKRMIKDNHLSEIRSLSGKKGGKSTQKSNKNFAKAKTQANNKANIKANTEYENEYEIDNVNDNKKGIVKGKKSKEFTAPTLEEFINYFIENDYSKDLATRAWKGYDAAQWKDARGNQIKNWKQKCQHVWFSSNNQNHKISTQSATPKSKSESVIDIHYRVNAMIEEEERFSKQ